MMNDAKLYILPMVLLAACSTGFDPSGLSIGIGGGNGHVGMGTTVHFPMGGHHDGDINGVHQKIITYFNGDNRPQNTPSKGGSYRQLLATQSADLYLVQDFYVDNGKKRTDPMLISKRQLTDFAAYPADGSQTLYYPSGNLHTQTQYRNGKAIHSQSWADR